jgi:hypothetical protein
MRHRPEMIEGTEAFTRFEKAMKKVLSVPRSEIQRRVEEHRSDSALIQLGAAQKPKKRLPVKSNASRGVDDSTA